jgi:hypothetical protein
VNAIAITDCDKRDDMAIGHITLHISPFIQEQIARMNESSTVWDHLEVKYGKSTPTTIYKDFKEVLSVQLLADHNPLPAIEKMAASFQRLSEAKVTVPEQIQAMMLLSALPQKWEMLLSIVTQQKDLDKIKFLNVCNAILTQYQSESVHGKPGQRNNGNNRGQQANKLSAVHCKRDNPNFSQQQQGDGQQLSGDKSKCQRGQRSKGKQCQQQQQNHSHIANPTIVSTPSVPTPTTATIVEVTSTGPSKHKITPLPPAPSEHTPGPYQSLNKALDLADHLGVTPTIQTTKTLEERITKQYKDGPWSKGTYCRELTTI